MAEFNSCSKLINDDKIKECDKLYEDLLKKRLEGYEIKGKFIKL